MRIIYNKIFLEHDIQHPENKNRLSYFTNLEDTEIENGERYLKLVHSSDYINFVKEACKREANLDADTMTCKRSYEVACYAVGASIQAAKQQAFALVRPPGHHASRDRAGGFCIFNNIAIATKFLLEQGKRVFITDVDLHHGQGTQGIFFGEKNVFYFSLHQSPLYPGTGLESEKNCINIPLPFGTSDKRYVKELEAKLVPALNKFNPDIVGVSAGFDGYYKDFCYMNPTAGFKLTKKSYKKIKEILKPHKTFFVLEGGYNPESIRECVDVFLE